MTPTRELALQILKEFKQVTHVRTLLVLQTSSGVSPILTQNPNSSGGPFATYVCTGVLATALKSARCGLARMWLWAHLAASLT